MATMSELIAANRAEWPTAVQIDRERFIMAACVLGHAWQVRHLIKHPEYVPYILEPHKEATYLTAGIRYDLEPEDYMSGFDFPLSFYKWLVYGADEFPWTAADRLDNQVTYHWR